jgi:tRNA (adenine22-N1)-methyltransferase
MTAASTRPLDGRLLAVAELIPEGSRVADVGSGHGLLPRHLLETGRASFCVATERNERRLGSVARSPGLELRHGDGLAPLLPSDRLDVVAIAGLGGPSIARILGSRRRESLRVLRLVLQPQTGAADLRRWLAGNGLALVDERLALSAGRLYPVLAAEPGPWRHHDTRLDPEDLLEAGPCLVLRRDPLLRPLWEREEERLVSILGRARPGGGRRAAEARLALARRVLAAL